MEHVGADLSLDMVAAELPRQAHEPGGIFRPDFEQRLGPGAHHDQPAVLQAQGIAILQRAGLGQRDLEGEAAGRREGGGQRDPGAMVEFDRIGDAVGAYGRAADDGGGFQHGRLEFRRREHLRRMKTA